MKNIEQLTLIFMNTFDLTIKHRQRIEDDAIALSDQLAERGFVGKFNGPDIINNSSIIGGLSRLDSKGKSVGHPSPSCCKKAACRG